MSTAQVSNAMPQPESKTAKKKKAKGEVAPQISAPSTEPELGARRGSVEAGTNGADGVYESPYIKELYKYATLLHVDPQRPINGC